MNDDSQAAEMRRTLISIFEAAVEAAHPRSFLPGLLPLAPPDGRVIVLAAGKAAGSMTALAERHYLDRGLPPDRLAGIAIARHGYTVETQIVPMIAAGHPVPDAAGVEATLKALELAGSAVADDLVLVLLSGGGSANWIAPVAGVSLADKQALTKSLLRSGANIQEINTVRKHLSRIKGGRLAALAAPARILTLAVSDVPRDDPSTIASGPTVPDPTTLADARNVLAEFGITPSDAIIAALNDPANESPKEGDPAFKRAEFKIAVRPSDALQAATNLARSKGYEPVVLGADLEGEASDVAAAQARLAIDCKRAGKKVAILSGGELTVTIAGQGRGGPNQEFALALALALDGESGICALSGDTDGTDGGGGDASDPAGALIDETTLRRAEALGLSAEDFLADNDSTGFFEKLGDLLQPGPTMTNVNDLRVILVDP